MNYIEQNFQNDISIEEIAGVCGINRSYLGKIFKNSVGHSPQEFLMNYRMIKATELLKLTSLSIADVGSAVGYEISFISHAPLKISTEWLRGSGGTSINKLTVHPSQIHLHCQGSPSHTADKHTFYPQTLCFHAAPGGCQIGKLSHSPCLSLLVIVDCCRKLRLLHCFKPIVCAVHSKNAGTFDSVTPSFSYASIAPSAIASLFAITSSMLFLY